MDSLLIDEDCKLKLPGFDIDCRRFWAGKPLRYVFFYDPEDGSERQVIASVAFRLQETAWVSSGSEKEASTQKRNGKTNEVNGVEKAKTPSGTEASLNSDNID